MVIDGRQIKQDSITGNQIKDGSIDSDDIKPGEVKSDAIAAEAIDSDKIKDDSIVNADISATADIDISKLNQEQLALLLSQITIDGGTF